VKILNCSVLQKNNIGCIADTLRQALLTSLEDNRTDVHKQCAVIRVLSGISRARGSLHYMQQFCLDLISAERPLTINQLPMLQSVVGVWPLVLSRKVCFCYACNVYLLTSSKSLSCVRALY